MTQLCLSLPQIKRSQSNPFQLSSQLTFVAGSLIHRRSRESGLIDTRLVGEAATE
jgi:hypothetical protein